MIFCDVFSTPILTAISDKRLITIADSGDVIINNLGTPDCEEFYLEESLNGIIQSNDILAVYSSDEIDRSYPRDYKKDIIEKKIYLMIFFIFSSNGSTSHFSSPLCNTCLQTCKLW